LERPSGITYAIPVQYVHDLVNSAAAAAIGGVSAAP
jgi:hypothetical protein